MWCHAAKRCIANWRGRVSAGLRSAQPRAGIDVTREPAIFTRHPTQVALDAYRGLMRGRRVVVPGFACAVAAMAARYSPRAWTLQAVERHNSRAGRRSSDST